jgi:hypothetical protein
MRTAVLALVLTLPGLCLGQSLADAAKREKARRELNKREGKPVRVISESELTPPSSSPPAESGETGGEVSRPETVPSSSPSTSSSSSSAEESSEDEESAPEFIPPDRPLEERLDLFARMKRHYERQVAEIDEQIAKNEARLKEIEAEIGATSALGGAGLPVAPQTGTGAATRQMTGQESASLVGEQQRLQAVNGQLRSRKEQLKVDLQAKGRVGGIPPGYLRF